MLKFKNAIKKRIITIFLMYWTLLFPMCLFRILGTIVMVTALPSSTFFTTSFSSSLASSSASLDTAEPQSDEVAEW